MAQGIGARGPFQAHEVAVAGLQGGQRRERGDVGSRHQPVIAADVEVGKAREQSQAGEVGDALVGHIELGEGSLVERGPLVDARDRR